MRHNRLTTKLTVIWGAGAVFALILYLTGPDRFLNRLESALADFSVWLDDTIALMSAASFDALRAGALALYAVFVVLALTAASRGLRARWALFWVSILFLLLVGTGPSGSAPRWLVACALTGAGAGAMTTRLLRTPTA